MASDSGTRAGPILAHSPSTVKVPRFMAGEPMEAGDELVGGTLVHFLRGADLLEEAAGKDAMRSPIVRASVWSWVTYTVVTPSSRCREAICVRVWTRSFASRFDSGSSMRNTLGLRTMARPMATR